MKKIFCFLVTVFSLILSTSCDRVKFYLSHIVLTDYDTPYITTIVNDEQVENTFIKDAKVSIYEITEEEYNKRNGENAFIEILSNTKIKGRYIGLDLQVLIDEEKGYQEVTIYDIEYSDYSTNYNCKYKIFVNNEYIVFEGNLGCQTYGEDDIYENIKCSLTYSNQTDMGFYILFTKPELINNYMRNLYEFDCFNKYYTFEIKVISEEIYNKNIGMNVFKQDTWGEFENVNRYIQLNIISKDNNVIYEVSNLKCDFKYSNKYVGDIKLTYDDNIRYGRITLYLSGKSYTLEIEYFS